MIRVKAKRTMTVDIPTGFQQFVHSAVESGSYRSEAEVVGIALALLRDRDQCIPAEVYETAVRLGVAQYWPQVVDLTRRVYSGFSGVEVAYDPESPDDVHIVFSVPVRGSTDEALDKDVEWARGLQQIIPRCPRVYLTQMDFRE
jgi:hypothetical protein